MYVMEDTQETREDYLLASKTYMVLTICTWILLLIYMNRFFKIVGGSVSSSIPGMSYDPQTGSWPFHLRLTIEMIFSLWI